MPHNSPKPSFSPHSFSNRWWFWLVAIVLGLAIALVIRYISELNAQTHRQNQRAEVLQELALLRARLEGNMTTNMQTVQGLVAAISLNPNISQEEFAAFSRHFISGHTQIRNIGGAPDLVIRYMYPIEGNESAIGFDYNQDPTQRDAALRARESSDMVVAGPVNLVQGGQGFIGRIPVYYSGDHGRQFWGLVSAVIDVERFYRASGLEQQHPRLEIAIRGKDGLGATGAVFYGSEDVFTQQPVYTSVNLPQGYWQIAGIPRGGWGSSVPNQWAFNSLLGLIGLMLLVLALATLRFAQKTRDSEKLFKGLFDMSPVGITLNEFQSGRLLRANDAFLKATGFTTSEIKSLRQQDLAHKSDTRNFTSEQQALLVEGALGPEEHILQRANGAPLPASISTMLTHGTGGELLMWSIIEDISERKRSETNLKASHQDRSRQMALLQTIAATQAQFIGLADPSTAFTELLQKILTITASECGFIAEIISDPTLAKPNLKTHALSHSHLPNNSAVEETLECEFDALKPLFDIAIKTLEPVISHTPEQDLLASGINSNVRCSLDSFLALPITHNNTGVALLCLGNRKAGYDRALVEWLEPLTHTLAQIITSMHISHERDQTAAELLKAKEDAESAAKAKSEFLAMMSQEIRTPLNGIMGMLNLIKHGKLNDKQQHQITFAQHSAESLLRIINDILDFSKIDAGRLSLDYLEFDLRSLLDDVVGSFAARAHSKGLDLVVDLSAIDQSMVKGDANRIQQVLVNLLSNALKFTHQGRIKVQAQLLETKHTTQLQVSVADTGIGIPVEKLPYLFAPFNHLDATPNRQHNGTGLGLAVCKKLCILMGGDITLQTALHKGSVFSFTISLVPSRASRYLHERLDLSRHSALIAGDPSEHGQVLARQLQALGAQVDYAQTLAQLETWLAESPNHDTKRILAVDCDNHTSDLVKHIISGRSGANLPLLMLGEMGLAHAPAAQERNVPSAACSKPLHTEQLLKALKSLLAPKSHTQSEQAPKEIYPWAKGKRVLLVEGVQQHGSALNILQDKGFEVAIAHNGEEALQMLQGTAETFNTILMDCQLPILDGFQTTAKIRTGMAGNAYIETPIVAMTNPNISSEAEQCFAAGMSAYIAKPLDAHALLDTLKQLLA